MTSQQIPNPGGDQIELLRKHLRRKPNDGHAWLTLVRLLSKGPPCDELYHAIEQSIKSLPENYDVWSLAVEVQQHIRGLAAAQQWLEHTARQNPQLNAPQLALARLQFAGDPDGAIAHCEIIAEKLPQDTQAQAVLRQLRLERGDTYRQSGLWNKALADYRQVEMSRADDPLLLNNIGCCLAGIEAYESAANYFRQALRLQPGLVQARLNVGLLCANQMKSDEAAARISEVLKDQDIDPVTRQAAQTILDILSEHRRLEPLLRQAVQCGSVGELQAALAKTPEKLIQPDERSVKKLRTLAAKFREFEFGPQPFSYHADMNHFPFVEAFVQSKAEVGTREMTKMYKDLSRPTADQDASPENRKILIVRNVNIDRLSLDADLLQTSDGEAWLRYWHARLLSETPEKLPGHYKAATNAIGDRALTPPENVAGTFRVLLTEIRSTLPPGLARAAFMYVAVNMIHGFADGNGRLSRFILNWEAESAAVPPIVIPLSMRARVTQCMDVAWFEGAIEPLVRCIEDARAETGRLLEQLQMATEDK